MDAGFIAKLEQNGYAEKDARIVWYNCDPDSGYYFRRQEKRLCLTTPRGNLPGIYYRINAGNNSVRNSKSGLIKNILLVVLKEFGFDYFVSVSTGEIFVNGKTMMREQCKAFLRFCKIFAAHHFIQRDAGNTWQQIQADDGPYCVQTMTQWPVTARSHEQNKQTVSREMVKWVNDWVHDRVDRLNAENASEERQNPDYQAQLFYELKSDDRNRRIREARNLPEKLDIIHEIRPELVTLDRPSPTPYIDGIVCKYSRCFSISCANNVAKIEMLRDMFNRYKRTAVCVEHNGTNWNYGIWMNRNTQSKLSLFIIISFSTFK